MCTEKERINEARAMKKTREAGKQASKSKEGEQRARIGA
jgi:hypothetical protein